MVGGTVVGLLLGEVALRVVAPQPMGEMALARHPDLLDAPIPLARGTITIPGVYEYTFHHDDQGRRLTGELGGGPEILLLGDSFAYGMGVDDGETTAASLDRHLARLGTEAEVVNAGVPGKDPVYALRLLQTRGRAWTPAVAVYLFYPNDWPSGWYQTLYSVEGDSLVPREPSDPWQERRIAISGNPGFRFVRARSHVVALSWRAAIATFGENPPANGDPDTLSAPVEWSWDGAVEAMAPFASALRDALAARRAQLKVAYAPTASEVAYTRRTGSATPERTRFWELCRRVSLDCLDLTDAIVQTPAAVGDLYFPEAHWRARTHEIAARELAGPVSAMLSARGARPTDARLGAAPSGGSSGRRPAG